MHQLSDCCVVGCSQAKYARHARQPMNVSQALAGTHLMYRPPSSRESDPVAAKTHRSPTRSCISWKIFPHFKALATINTFSPGNPRNFLSTSYHHHLILILAKRSTAWSGYVLHTIQIRTHGPAMSYAIHIWTMQYHSWLHYFSKPL
jgi:hypothetical protein